ncbi:hypothetical protein CASFOL_013367 [Castilleja foliolosa]|uniref:Uncharacterized protein n=1 Tax=Castilleja foliolosa TaxID=1961234 RepID=A0ABD3DKH9_9LAMI
MWQVLLAAAAAAGSGILAKKLINPSDTESPFSDLNQQCAENQETLSGEDEIFRFSSVGSKRLSKHARKKGFRVLKKNIGSKKKDAGGEKEIVVDQSGKKNL